MGPMGERLQQITPRVQRFIEAQHLFFVGTAATDGRVNVSPKGLDTLRILGPDRVAWLNLTGSGNETAAHVRDTPRMTLMFCAFAGKPWIVRLYGTATMTQPGDETWPQLSALFPALPGERQVFELAIDLVTTACGFAVPRYDYRDDRTVLTDWADKLGPDGLRTYRRAKNTVSLDGLPTGLQQDGS